MTSKTPALKIVLIDAHAVLHRAYHALPDFNSSQGEPTGGLYGLSLMLIKIITDFKPDYIFACYDRAEPTFRKQVYDHYKAKRPKAEPALVSQIIRSRDIFNALNIPIYDQSGFEADDIIGTIVKKLTTDHQDFLPSSTQIIIASGDMDTLQLVKNNQVVVFTLKKGLNDTIIYNEDLVRERYGFDPVFLVDYKGLRGDPSDNIIGVEGIGEKTASILIKEFGTIENLYRQIKTDEKSLLAKGLKPRIIGILKENEEEAIFSKTLATIRLDVPINFIWPTKSWKEDFDVAQAERVFMELDFRTLVGRLKQLTGAPAVNINTDRINENELRETAIALWLINSDLTNPTIQDIYSYARSDNFKIAQKKIFADLIKLDLMKIYQEIELPLIPIINQAEKRGIKLDKKLLAELAKDYHYKLTEREEKIYQLAGQQFNINSPKQLGEVLFTNLKLSFKGLKKTAGGNQSTRESELIKLKDTHPIIDEILAYRELQKLLTTYIDNLPKLADQEGAIHTTLNQTGTTTGRMSSVNPNLQNIPTKGEQGLAIRRAFIARDGHLLASFDYSQIELRVLAILSKDPDLIQIFKTDQDVHSSVAMKVFGVPQEAVTKEMRRRAKVINFGIIYGMGVNALQVNIGATRQEAKQFQDNYFASFPTIKKYFETVIVEARKKGFTETLFGRRRYLPALKSPLPQIRASAERMAMNAPLQGTAADIIKLAMIKIQRDLEKNNLTKKVFLLLQVHDELIFEIKKEALSSALAIIQTAMEKVIDLDIPIKVSSATGRSWGELEK